jgi:hypothetical protein
MNAAFTGGLTARPRRPGMPLASGVVDKKILPSLGCLGCSQLHTMEGSLRREVRHDVITTRRKVGTVNSGQVSDCGSAVRQHEVSQKPASGTCAQLDLPNIVMD